MDVINIALFYTLQRSLLGMRTTDSKILSSDHQLRGRSFPIKFLDKLSLDENMQTILSWPEKLVSLG
jgi:hypothetical protein